MTKSKKPLYLPDVEILADGRGEQRFRADHVVIDRDEEASFIGFADTDPATIHSLLLLWPVDGIGSADELYVEFNDQTNGRSGDTVTLTLRRNSLSVDYAGEPIVSGRVSYEPAADPMQDDPDFETEPLHRVTVFLRLSDETYESVAAELRALAAHGVSVTFD